MPKLTKSPARAFREALERLTWRIQTAGAALLPPGQLPHLASLCRATAAASSRIDRDALRDTSGELTWTSTRIGRIGRTRPPMPD